MKYTAFALTALAKLSESTEHTFNRQNLVFRPYAFDLLSDFLVSQNYTVADVDNVVTHGCWCGKLDANNAYTEFLGGPDAVDELDEICRNWFKCRNCNDRLKGGTCNIEGNNSREILLAGEYTMTYDDLDVDAATCTYGLDTCSDDTCTIDLYYVKQIIDYVGENALSPIVISENSTCAASVQNDITRVCEGSAPYLTPTEEGGAAALLGDGWATVDTGASEQDDDAVANGATGTAVFKLFTENVDWFGARDRCLALGNGASLAAIYSDGEADLVHNLGASVSAWIGGNDQTSEGSWRWVQGANSADEVMSYDRWSSGEPNNAGNEDCAEKYTNGRWNDINCLSTRGAYICQVRF